jgi:putative hydrolase of the HAD superfamily
MKFAAILFDLDETLYDEADYVRSGFRQVAARIATMAERDPAEVLAFMEAELAHSGRGGVFDAALMAFGLELDKGLVAELVEGYRAHSPAIRLFADADAALRALHGRLPMGLVTDGLPQMQWAKIDALGLAGRMESLVCTWEHDLPKPDPGGFRRAMQQLGTTPEQTLIIGDRPDHDLAAAKALGCAAVRIRRGRFAGQASAPWQPLVEWSDLGGLVEWLA